MFAYYFYKVLNGKISENNINVIGLNYKSNLINGLGIWSNDIYNSKHVNIDALNNLYFDNHILKTNYYPEKEIHIITLTFCSFTLNNFKENINFKNLLFFLK